MSSAAAKPKAKVSSNASDASTLSVNERILKECYSLYTDSEKGLIKLANSLGLTLLAPRKKITVLLLGNHSAGKSSFINWYVEEHIQKTGVAIETQGFSFITSGRKRESLTGNATFHLYPHFEPLRKIEGVSDYISTEISTSKQKKFGLVTFVDSPGLVDGDMKYPFDVNTALLWLGDLADLIFVFFDPIGQALCKRTLTVVESLSVHHGDRLRFYLSKADEAGNESDRQRVLMQIVQELCKRPSLNRTGFDMPTIYVPNPNKPSRCVNQIDEVCKDIEKTINQTIQNTINSLEKDCSRIADLVNKRLQKDKEDRAYNASALFNGIAFYFGALLVPLLLSLHYVTHNHPDMVKAIAGESMAANLVWSLAPLNVVPDGYGWHIGAFLLFAALIMFLVAKHKSRLRSTLSKSEKRQLGEQKEYVETIVLQRKQALYQEYLRQSVADHDME